MTGGGPRLLQGGGDGPGGPVRQGQHDDVVVQQVGDVGGLHPASGQGSQVGVVLTEAGAGAGGGGERTDLQVGVRGQEAQDLSPGVTGRSGDRCCPAHT